MKKLKVQIAKVSPEFPTIRFARIVDIKTARFLPAILNFFMCKSSKIITFKLDEPFDLKDQNGNIKKIEQFFVEDTEDTFAHKCLMDNVIVQIRKFKDDVAMSIIGPNNTEIALI